MCFFNFVLKGMKWWSSAGGQRMNIDRTYPSLLTRWARNWQVKGSSRMTFTSTWERWRDTTRTRMHWENLDVKPHCLHPMRDNLINCTGAFHWWGHGWVRKLLGWWLACNHDKVKGEAWNNPAFPLPQAWGVFDRWPVRLDILTQCTGCCTWEYQGEVKIWLCGKNYCVLMEAQLLRKTD